MAAFSGGTGGRGPGGGRSCRAVPGQGRGGRTSRAGPRRAPAAALCCSAVSKLGASCRLALPVLVTYPGWPGRTPACVSNKSP